MGIFHFGTEEPRLVTKVEILSHLQWISNLIIICTSTSCYAMGNLITELHLFSILSTSSRLKREAREKGHVRVSWAYWFNKVLYYQVALVYVLTRLVTNVSQVMTHLTKKIS